MEFLGFLGKPLGILMGFIYQYVQEYFLTIFIFTFLVRLVLFPLNLKQQKSTMERARLAPALERIQKKYANDRQKLAEKQQALYEKHGVSMTGGCLPLLVSMIVLFGVIAAIYSPLTNMANPALSEQVISVAQHAIIAEGDEILEEDKAVEGKIPPKKVKSQLDGYYGELNLMKNVGEGTNAVDIVNELNDPSPEALARAYPKKDIFKDGKLNEKVYKETKKTFLDSYHKDYENGEAVYAKLEDMKKDFELPLIGSLLSMPWDERGFKSFGPLWLIPLISGLTSLAVSYISMQFTKKSQPQQMPGQGCTNNMMLIYMPLFSTWIAFSVPGAVGIYWIFSNLLSMVQTVLMNKIYDPAKARMQAEQEYQERRQKKEEDKKRLAQARQREEAEARKAEQEKERQREESREMNKKKKKKNNGGAAKQSDVADSEDATEQTVETDETAASDE